MDGFNEKKWFVYLTDHHEGPFSLAEIQSKMAQSQVTVANYIWAEGMTDWKPMTEVPEFESILSSSHATAAAVGAFDPAAPLAVGAMDEGTRMQFQSESVPAATPSHVADEKTGDLDPADLQQAKEQRAAATAQPILQISPGGPAAAPGPLKPKRSIARPLKWAAVILIPAGLAAAYFNGSLDPVLHSPAVKAGTQAIGDFAQPYLLKLAEKVPALANWVSPIPSLEDVAPDDYEALKAAAMQKLADGPKLAMALSTGDLFSPSFYVSSNLPEGAVIDVYVEGVPDTLLNQLSFSGKAQATITRKLGKTGVVRYPDGKAMPRGDYIVYATEGAQQPEAVKTILASVPPVTVKVPVASLPHGLKLLVSKPVFLGGLKDATYQSRLKEFHDKLREKVTAEFAEVKQLEATLESQLSQTTVKYNALRGGVRNGKVSPAARKGWADFNAQWTKLDDQLKQSFAKWTDQALQTEYFYGVLYGLTKAAGEAVEKLHQLHADFFAGKLDAKTFEIQRGSVSSVAEGAVAALKNKVTQAENLAPTPNGMPRREGL